MLVISITQDVWDEKSDNFVMSSMGGGLAWQVRLLPRFALAVDKVGEDDKNGFTEDSRIEWGRLDTAHQKANSAGP